MTGIPKRSTLPPQLPNQAGGNKTSNTTPPILPGQDPLDNGRPIIWGVAIAILILILLLIWAMLEKNSAGTSGKNNGVHSDTGDDQANGGTNAMVDQQPGSQTLSDDEKANQAPAANDSSLTDSESLKPEDGQTIASGATKNGEGTSEKIDPNEGAFANAGQASAPASIPSGTFSIGNLTGKAEFFGVSTGAGPVAYIIDNSSSMTGDSRFDTACRELLASVNRLEASPNFAVFLYNNQFTSFKNGALVKPTPTNKRAFRRWLKKFSCAGGTVPLPAVQAASQTGVKNIFLLSDGEFSDIAAQQISDLCKANEIIVHTYFFGGQSRTLKAIADQTGGSFVAIKP